MTSPKVITGFAGLLFAGLLLSWGLGGVWFGSGWSAFGSLSAYTSYNVMGLFTIPWVNLDFFTVGIPHLLSFDFAFFSGSYGFFKYAMYVFTVGVIWGIVILAIGVIGNFWTRR